MGLLGRLIRRGDRAPSGPSLNEQVAIAVASGEAMRGDSETEIAERQNLGKFFHALHDEDFEAVLANKTLRQVFVPDTDKDGYLIFQKDKDGNPVKDKNGDFVPVLKQIEVVDDNYAAIAAINSPVNRQVFLNPHDKTLMLLYAEDIIETTKMGRPESDFELGFGNYLDAQLYYNRLLINDAVNGNKVKTLFEIRKRLEFAPEQEKKKGVI